MKTGTLRPGSDPLSLTNAQGLIPTIRLICSNRRSYFQHNSIWCVAMKPGRIIDTVVSKIIGTPLEWPVKNGERLLGHLARTRDRWAERPRSRELQALSERFPIWMVRASLGGRGSAMKNLRRMPPVLDLPEYERQMAAYSAVMAAYRSWAVSTKDNFTLSNHFELQAFLEAAWFLVTPLDEGRRRKPLSLSRPRLGERPKIMFNRSSEIRATRNHQQSHELFHRASPLGGGLCKYGHAREILANRFAVEWVNSLPGLIYSAETDAASALDRPFAFEEVMRLSSRRMFSITIPADGDVSKGSIVLQARGESALWENQQTSRMPQSWDELLLWSKPGGSVDCRPTNVSWNPRLIPEDAQGFVNLQTTDGLYFFRPATGNRWSSLTETGIVDPGDFAEISPGIALYDVRDIPETVIEDRNSVIEGGRYLVLRMLRDVATYPDLGYVRTYQLLAVEDEDGCLYQAWEQAASGRKPSWGGLLPPRDPQRHDHLERFNDWWRANREWRESIFDHWAGMMTQKFMRDLTGDEKDRRRELEDEIRADARNGRIEPGFDIKSV